jgi:diacylglycerol kinase family enzyme
MEAYLVLNGTAGSASAEDAEFYQQALAEAGYQPVYRVTESEEDVLAVLQDARDLIVVVGGDGSLRAVATRLVGRGIPIAHIPAGTANNVAGALGMRGDPKTVARGLGNPKKVKVDIGAVKAPWGETHFLEGAGFGLYAEALSRYRPEEGKSVLRGFKILAEILSDLPSPTTVMRVNGRQEEGQYLLVEALNTPAIGPRIPLAREADMSDGLLDLIRVDASSRDSYLAYLRGLISGALPELESVQLERVRSFDFLWSGFPVHQDAVYQELESYRTDEGIWMTVEVLPGALEFWLPSCEEAEHAQPGIGAAAS